MAVGFQAQMPEVFEAFVSNADLELFVAREVLDEIGHSPSGTWATLKSQVSSMVNKGTLERFPGAVRGDDDNDIRLLGADLNRIVGIGEAYSHALALRRNGAVFSKDSSAVRTLQKAGKPFAPRLEPFDLMLLARKEGWVESRFVVKALKRIRTEKRLGRGSDILTPGTDPEEALDRAETLVFLVDDPAAPVSPANGIAFSRRKPKGPHGS
ncbi:MAG: hypothetical protein JNK60_09300 [Acidobacteria bacterium]|nr:hypothetical protein [Acidobacteriota bacterium]